MLIKEAAREQLTIQHPLERAINALSTLEFTGPPHSPNAHGRNAVVISTGGGGGVLDRSACGTGTCARMAVLHARGELDLNVPYVHEGILGTTFTGCLLEEATVGPYPAVVPSISGTAWITGISQYVLDPDDPFPEGFTVGDLWH